LKRESELLINREGRVCTLLINYLEKRNALSPECLLKMADTLKGFSQDGEIRTVVIRGAGGEAFSSGYDITALPTEDPAELEEALDNPPLELAIQSIRTFPYPVIAMINGYAYGAGCELAIACDIRVASKSARMGIPVVKLGIFYPYRGLRRFLTILGFSRTMEIFLTGRNYDSQQCIEMGLVSYVAESDHLESFTYKLAREIAGNAPLSLRGTKLFLNKIAEYPILKPEDEEEFRSLLIQSLKSGDLEEGK